MLWFNAVVDRKCRSGTRMQSINLNDTQLHTRGDNFKTGTTWNDLRPLRCHPTPHPAPAAPRRPDASGDRHREKGVVLGGASGSARV